MPAIRGRVTGIRGGGVSGWLLAGDADPPARVRVLVNGSVVAEADASLEAPPRVHERFGARARGFWAECGVALQGNSAPAMVRVLALPDEEELAGSPIEHRPAARGMATHVVGGVLMGWAHGEALSLTRVLLAQSGEPLVAWPATEHRPELRANGLEAYGFRLPLDALLGPHEHADLTLSIEDSGAQIPLPSAPEKDRPRGAHAEPFADAEAARSAILVAMARGVEGMAVSLSPRLWQGLLNRLAAAEQQLAEAQDLIELESRRVRAGRPKSPPFTAAGTAASGWALELNQLLSTDSPLTTEGRVAAAKELARCWNDSSPAERADFHSALLQHADPASLRQVSRAFRAVDALTLPAAAYRQSILSARKPPDAKSIRHLRQLQGWSDLAHDRPAIPATITAPARRARRRALYVLWRCLPYDQNGYVMRSHYLLRGLLASGEDVVGLTRLGYPWDAEKKIAADGMAEVHDGVTYLHLGGPDASRLTMPVQDYVKDCADRIAMEALTTGADIIHAASPWMVGLPALVAARRIGLPFCYEMRGLWEVTRASYTPGYERSEHFRLFSEMEAYVAGQADGLFTITAGVREEMARRGVDTSRARIAPNGCEVARFEPTPRDPELAGELGIAENEIVFGYIGTFAQYEGLPELCEAAAELSRRGLRFRLLLVGDGPLRERVEAQLHSLDHAGRIILRGRVPFEEVPRYYSLVDVAVFPRIPADVTEMVSPLKPFEAMAMAKPVIGSDVRAIAEIVRDGETGWLFRKGDLSSLVETMAQVLAMPDAIARAGSKARDFVLRHHDWTVIAQGISQGWAELRARGGRQGGPSAPARSDGSVP